jgi:hypothetical protein
MAFGCWVACATFTTTTSTATSDVVDIIYNDLATFIISDDAAVRVLASFELA